MTNGLLQADKNLLQKPDLFTLLSLLVGYRHHLRVVGKSMLPFILEGDLLIYKKINSKKYDLKVGDLVIASHPKLKSHLIIKRIYKIDQKKFDLRGDNPLSSTDSREWGLINFNLIVGKVVKIFRD